MKNVLLIIVIAQFFCTSLWFAGNAIILDIINDLNLETNFLANVTSAVQFGFIIGTLFYAVFAIADRVSPSKVFFISAVLAGIFNLGIVLNTIDANKILLFRFLTGFFLAGIYPVGMKIAADYYDTKLGKSLGYLVGALVIGTAFPHLLKTFTIGLPWKYVLYATSTLSVLGGLAILLFVPDGPFRKIGQKLKYTAFLSSFKNKTFRAAAFGYFGHMWELYTFWAFVPIILTTYNNNYPSANLNVSLFSFLIIGFGGIACVISGLLSQKNGVRKTATLWLFLSALCCLVSPLFLLSNSIITLLTFLFIWGFVVIADSPLLSTLVAQNATPETKGTALTIVNCIGFSITIVSIQCITYFSEKISYPYSYLILAIGPVLGCISLLTKNKKILN